MDEEERRRRRREELMEEDEKRRREEELEDQFMIEQLNNKIMNQPVQIENLITAEINDHHPQDFFPAHTSGEKECCVLTPRRLVYGLIWLPDRRAKNGYWKGLGYIDGKIYGKSGLVGTKQILFFHEGSINRWSETNWRMIEYRLNQHSCSDSCDHKYGRLDHWVLCKVYEDVEIQNEILSDMEDMNIEE